MTQNFPFNTFEQRKAAAQKLGMSYALEGRSFYQGTPYYGNLKIAHFLMNSNNYRMHVVGDSYVKDQTNFWIRLGRQLMCSINKPVSAMDIPFYIAETGASWGQGYYVDNAYQVGGSDGTYPITRHGPLSGFIITTHDTARATASNRTFDGFLFSYYDQTYGYMFPNITTSFNEITLGGTYPTDYNTGVWDSRWNSHLGMGFIGLFGGTNGITGATPASGVTQGELLRIGLYDKFSKTVGNYLDRFMFYPRYAPWIKYNGTTPVFEDKIGYRPLFYHPINQTIIDNKSRRFVPVGTLTAYYDKTDAIGTSVANLGIQFRGISGSELGWRTNYDESGLVNPTPKWGWLNSIISNKSGNVTNFGDVVTTVGLTGGYAHDNPYTTGKVAFPYPIALRSDAADPTVETNKWLPGIGSGVWYKIDSNNKYVPGLYFSAGGFDSASYSNFAELTSRGENANAKIQDPARLASYIWHTTLDHNQPICFVYHYNNETASIDTNKQNMLTLMNAHQTAATLCGLDCYHLFMVPYSSKTVSQNIYQGNKDGFRTEQAIKLVIDAWNGSTGNLGDSPGSAAMVSLFNETFGIHFGNAAGTSSANIRNYWEAFNYTNFVFGNSFGISGGTMGAKGYTIASNPTDILDSADTHIEITSTTKIPDTKGFQQRSNMIGGAFMADVFWSAIDTASHFYSGKNGGFGIYAIETNIPNWLTEEQKQSCVLTKAGWEIRTPGTDNPACRELICAFRRGSTTALYNKAPTRYTGGVYSSTNFNFASTALPGEIYFEIFDMDSRLNSSNRQIVAITAGMTGLSVQKMSDSTYTGNLFRLHGSPQVGASTFYITFGDSQNTDPALFISVGVNIT